MAISDKFKHSSNFLKSLLNDSDLEDEIRECIDDFDNNNDSDDYDNYSEFILKIFEKTKDTFGARGMEINPGSWEIKSMVIGMMLQEQYNIL